MLVEALRRLDAAEIACSTSALRRPTLDDVFLTLTGHAAEEAGRRRHGRATPRSSARMSGASLTKAAGRRRDRRPAQPDQDQAGAGPAGLHDHLADHVRPAVRLRLRQRDPRPGHQLPRVPDPGDLRADRHLRRHHSPAPGWPTTCRRASSTGSARCRWRARRCWSGAPSATSLNNVLVARRHVADRAGRRLADPHQRGRGDRRLPAAAAVRLRDLLGHGADRAARARRRRSSTTPPSS